MRRTLDDVLDSLPSSDEYEVEEMIPQMPRRSAPTAAVRTVTRHASDHMRRLHADPRFAAEHRERGRRQARYLNSDPAIVAKKTAILAELNSDPEFKARSREAARQAQLRRWAKVRKEQGRG